MQRNQIFKRIMPAYLHLHSCHRLFRLWLMMLLLCGLPATNYSVLAQADVTSKAAQEESFSQSDGLHRYMMLEQQKMPAGFVITAKNGERIGSSRPVRPIPTHGGKPGRMLARLTSSGSVYLSNLHALLLCLSAGNKRAWAASPRLYYVIALRRILC